MIGTVYLVVNLYSVVFQFLCIFVYKIPCYSNRCYGMVLHRGVLLWVSVSVHSLNIAVLHLYEVTNH